jgi:hypothetical protein
VSEIAVFHLDGSETTAKSSSAKRDEAMLLYRLVGSIQTNSKKAEIAEYLDRIADVNQLFPHGLYVDLNRTSLPPSYYCLST